jgi:tryptophan synthase alpha chain
VAGELPVCVGLGVSNGDQAAEVAGFADGVIVGSAYVRQVLDGRGPDGVRALSVELAEGVRRGAGVPS